MSLTDSFNGAKIAYSDYFSYINTVIEELGMEHTCALLTRSDEARGTLVGKGIKEHSAGKEFDAIETAKTILSMANEIGAVDDVLEQSPQKVVTVTKFGNCPLYEAAKIAGFNDITIEQLCHASSLRFFDTMVKQLNPNLSYQLRKFRSAEDGGCVEEIVLANQKD